MLCFATTTDPIFLSLIFILKCISEREMFLVSVSGKLGKKKFRFLSTRVEPITLGYQVRLLLGGLDFSLSECAYVSYRKQ